MSRNEEGWVRTYAPMDRPITERGLRSAQECLTRAHELRASALFLTWELRCEIGNLLQTAACYLGSGGEHEWPNGAVITSCWAERMRDYSYIFGALPRVELDANEARRVLELAQSVLNSAKRGLEVRWPDPNACIAAWEKGAAAFLAGQKDTENPYDRATQLSEYRYWYDGWLEEQWLSDLPPGEEL